MPPPVSDWVTNRGTGNSLTYNTPAPFTSAFQLGPQITDQLKVADHYIFSVDSVAGTCQCYQNGVAVSATATNMFNAFLGTSIQNPCPQGYEGTYWGNFFPDGAQLSEVYFSATPSFYDLSIPANLAKFVTSRNSIPVPVALGSNGQIPTGSSAGAYYTLMGTDISSNYAPYLLQSIGVQILSTSPNGPVTTDQGGFSPLNYRYFVVSFWAGSLGVIDPSNNNNGLYPFYAAPEGNINFVDNFNTKPLSVGNFMFVLSNNPSYFKKTLVFSTQYYPPLSNSVITQSYAFQYPLASDGGGGGGSSPNITPQGIYVLTKRGRDGNAEGTR